jgi:hypothetical protein
MLGCCWYLLIGQGEHSPETLPPFHPLLPNIFTKFPGAQTLQYPSLAPEHPILEPTGQVSQSLQPVCPILFWNWPAGQNSQALIFWYWPAEQLEQNAEPAVGLHFPLAHNMHSVWPVEFWYLPGGHNMHSTLLF